MLIDATNASMVSWKVRLGIASSTVMYNDSRCQISARLSHCSSPNSDVYIQCAESCVRAHKTSQVIVLTVRLRQDVVNSFVNYGEW